MSKSDQLHELSESATIGLKCRIRFMADSYWVWHDLLRMRNVRRGRWYLLFLVVNHNLKYS